MQLIPLCPLDSIFCLTFCQRVSDLLYHENANVHLASRHQTSDIRYYARYWSGAALAEAVHFLYVDYRFNKKSRIYREYWVKKYGAPPPDQDDAANEELAMNVQRLQQEVAELRNVVRMQNQQLGSLMCGMDILLTRSQGGQPTGPSQRVAL